MIWNNGCRAGAPRKRRRGSGGLSQPSFTREKTNQASTANPKSRRKGFTPRSTSSPAHSASAAEARTTRTACTQPWGCTSHITPDASNHSVSDQLGSWASVIRPVVRLRNIQLTTPERFPFSSGPSNSVSFGSIPAPGSPNRMAPRVNCDSPCTGVRRRRFVAVPGDVRHDVALFVRRMRVVGSLGRPVVAFLRQGRVCALHLGARVVLQHVRDRLPSGVEGEGACIAGSAFVPQLYESAMDVPVLVAGPVSDVVLGSVVAVSHRDQCARCQAIMRQTSLSLSRRAQVPATSMRSATPSIRGESPQLPGHSPVHRWNARAMTKTIASVVAAARVWKAVSSRAGNPNTAL